MRSKAEERRRRRTGGSDEAPGPGGQRATLAFAGLVACFALSGFAALLYQTAWLRQFSAVFGTTELAVAAVLAAYMGGLAGGAAVGGRLAARIERPVLAYGLLEAGIAVSALAVPLLLLSARALYAAVLGHQPNPPDASAFGQPVFYLLVAFLVLALPTGFMGATLPLLTRYAVRRDAEVGPRVALLYATNTAGAVLGTLVAGFVLLPALGLRGTVWVGVAVNLLVFAVAALLAKRVVEEKPLDGETRITGKAPRGFAEACLAPLLRREGTPGDRLRAAFSAQPGWILPLMLVSGANAFFYEVLWTRMLAHVLGGSVYAFATMLAAFLAGIALGGGLAGKVAARRERAAPAFAVTQAAIAGLSVGVYQWMGPLIPDAHTPQHLALYAIAVLLPATLFIGATFPLAVRILARDEREASVATARVYAWNTAGAIVGAVLAGFVLIPALGFEGAIKLAVAVNLALALWSIAFVARPNFRYASVCAAALLLCLGLYHPSRPQAVISSTGFALQYPVAPRELFYRVGRSSTVMLLEEDGHYFLRTNGLPEATLPAKGGVPTQDAEKWLTALPVVARPQAKSMLVVGYGGGVALEGVPRSVNDVDVVELEPEVIDANRFLEGKRDVDPLADPRVHVVLNDARNALRLTDKTYDSIVSQPSHPWTAGASHLFTREFVAEAKRHLNDNGVFVQWISAEFVDGPLLRTLAATVLAEFDHVRLYQPAPRILMFVASSGPLDIESRLARTGKPLSADILHYSYMGMNGVEDLLAALVTDEAGLRAFAAGAPISTDDDNRMATRSRFRADGLALADLLELFSPYDPLIEKGSWVHGRLAGSLNFGYLARRLIRSGQQGRAIGLAKAVADDSNRFLIEGLVYRDGGQWQQAQQAFASALRANPQNMQARYHLIEDRLGTLSAGKGSAVLEDLAAGLSEPAAAVLEGWSYGAARDWGSLARLDNELARTRVTDAWYPQAVTLRAMWRTRVSRGRQRYGFDAVRLIDRALVLAPDQQLYFLRALGATATEDPDLMIESFRYFAATLRRRLRSGETVAPEDLSAMRHNLASMASRLSGELAGADPMRAGVVLDDVTELIGLIDRHSAVGPRGGKPF
jgi:spermidine synthase